MARPERAGASLDLFVRHRFQLVGQVVVGAVGGGHAMGKRRGTGQSPCSSAMEPLAGDGGEVLVEGLAVERVSKLGRTAGLAGVPDDETGRQERLERRRRPVHSRHTSDNRQSGRLVQHRHRCR